MWTFEGKASAAVAMSNTKLDFEYNYGVTSRLLWY